MRPLGTRAPRVRSAPKKKRKPLPGALRWWPFVVGVIVAAIAVPGVEVLTLSGPWGSRLILPWIFLFRALNPGLPDHTAQILMYSQFPLYGLIVMALQRRLTLLTSVCIVVAFHVVGVAVLSAVAAS